MAETVLVVDDDQDFLEATSTLLQAAGYEVMTASTREEALEAVNRRAPDAILLDLIMERADSGFALAHTFKRRPSLAGVPIIMVSGVTDAFGHRYSLNTPEERAWIKADMFLEKPLRPEDLLGHISQAIEHARDKSAH